MENRDPYKSSLKKNRTYCSSVGEVEAHGGASQYTLVIEHTKTQKRRTIEVKRSGTHLHKHAGDEQDRHEKHRDTENSDKEGQRTHREIRKLRGGGIC